MKIHSTFEAAESAEPGLVLRRPGNHVPTSNSEMDWGFRLRGGGLPGGEHGWLLTFARKDHAFAPNASGWLIAYEIDRNKKTGRVAIVRREWDSNIDDAQLKLIKSDATIWDSARRDEDGEADIDVIDKKLPPPIVV
jgi:hypothetical protein